EPHCFPTERPRTWRPVDHSTIARGGSCPVLLAGHLSFLLEAMQYIDGFLEPGDIHHAVDATRVPDANLSGTGTHIVERLPNRPPQAQPGSSPTGNPLPSGRLLGMPADRGRQSLPNGSVFHSPYNRHV